MTAMNSSSERRRVSISLDPRLCRDDFKVKIKQELEWIDAEPIAKVNLQKISSSRKIGNKSLIRPKETNFCDGDTYGDLCRFQNFYHKIPTQVAADSARGRSNPFERVENGIFQNRAGMKLANIDYDLNFELTDPRKPDKTSVIPNNDVLHFVDICAGPGGFSEYILWRRGFAAKGTGITLRNTACNFNRREFQAGPVECYELDYGHPSIKSGINNTGDIYDPENVKSFITNVMKSTDGIGVQLVLADGGIDKTGHEDQHENMCKQLYLAEFVIGLSVLKTNGIMVCKMFDTYTPFTVGLIYLVHLCFDKMTLYKPKTSRPQNSERYMICKYKREGIEPIIKYFTECHGILFENSKNKQDLDIIELVPLEILKWNSFYQNILKFNNTLAKNQILALKQVQIYLEDPSMKHPDQMIIREKCFEEFQIPMAAERRIRNNNKMKEMRSEAYERLWKCRDDCNHIKELEEQELISSEFEAHFKSPYDWRIIIVQGRGSTIKETRGFYMSQGGTDVFRFNGKEWVDIPIKIEIPKDTLLYGEIVTEFTGTGVYKKKEQTFHIIDALCINGTDLCDKHYIYRHEMCTRLAKSVNKSGQYNLNLVRAKQLVRMENMDDVLDKCGQSELKDENGRHWVCPIDHTDERSPVIKAAGIMLLKLTKHPWMMNASRRSGQKYWFNVSTRESRYEIPIDSVSTFIDTMRERVLWKWTSETNMNVDMFPSNEIGAISPIKKSEDKVHAMRFMKFVREFQSARLQVQA